MKKLLSLLLSLLLVFSLSSCKNSNTNNVSNEDIIQPIPQLQIKVGEQTANAIYGYYNYNAPIGDNHSQGGTQDYVNPLDLMQKPNIPIITTNEKQAILNFVWEKLEKQSNPKFNTNPDKISIVSWSDKEWGNTTATSEDVSLNDNTITLKPNGNIYEVKAEWTDKEKTSGTFIYHFCIISE